MPLLALNEKPMTDTERKARQRRSGVDENKASAERVDAALVRTIQDMGRRFSGKRTAGRARSPFELPLIGSGSV